MKPPVAIIGGSGISNIIKGQRLTVGTPYGPTPPLTVGELEGKKVIFIPRHGENHSAPPHKVNYRANIHGLKKLGVERIIATNAVGAIDQRLTPGDIVIPNDLVDFTRSRHNTFYEGPPVTHIDVSEPYCPTLRGVLTSANGSSGHESVEQVVMACTEGPRYETPAEIRMLRTVGCGIVGMTGAPEVFLARELELCYASICFISNMAAGLQNSLSAQEGEDRGRDTIRILNDIIAEAVREIPDRRTCPCAKALASAQLSKPERAREGGKIA